MNRLVDALESDLPLIHAALTRNLRVTLAAVAVFFIALQWGFYAFVIAGAEGYVTRFDQVIGGDFVVFHEAAKAAWRDPAEFYGYGVLNPRLAETFPAYGRDFGLGWQYPPTIYLFVAPLAAAPYPVAYGLWVVGGVAAFCFAARRLWSDPLALALLAAMPAVFQTSITGQTGLFTGALFLLAAYAPDKRPIVAGIAAGLLTIKPQLGLLIPVAFAAAGAWRAFFVAALTAISMALAAYGLFGAETWIAFYEALTDHGGKMSGVTGFPVNKLTTVFGFVTTAGATPAIAFAAQAAGFLVLAAIVAAVYKSDAISEAKAATLMTASLMAAPYVFYYELPIAAGALFLITRVAAREGVSPGEGLAIAALWVAPAFMPGEAAPALPLVAMGAMAAFACAVRRTNLFPLRLKTLGGPPAGV